jgi:UDP-N-acetylglucosamine acyltransferase
MSSLSSLSFIHPKATLGSNVEVLPFCYIDEDVVVGDNCKIGPNATLLAGTRLGMNNVIFPGAVLGAVPQDLKFSGEYSTLIIGNNNVIREGVTLNRGTKETGTTIVGDHCLLMAYVHVAHDCILGNHVVLSNGVQLAGHVQIDDYAVLGGHVLVQQFCRIGRFSFIAGAGLVRKNVPPFVRVAREPLSYMGVNKIGLSRKGFQQTEINEIKDIYNLLFVFNTGINKGLSTIRDTIFKSAYKDEIIDFVNQSKSLIAGINSYSTQRENENNTQGPW